MQHDWVVRPVRPLPRPVTPMHDETITSYLARLAHANRLDPDALRVHVTADKRKTALASLPDFGQGPL